MRCNGSFAPVRRERLAEARLYLVLDLRAETERIVRAALAGGTDVVQLRDKEAPDAEIVPAAGRLRALCHSHGALFVLNDRPDLAAACDADGVHIGQDDAGVDAARAAVGPERLVGLSTHSRAQLEAAVGVDYASVGPVWETPTKEGRAAVGLELLRFASEHARVPFFAIGGIDQTNIGEVVGAGATRVAVVRAIRDAANPEGAARRLRAALPA